MNFDPRRITLVSRHSQLPERKWVHSPESPGRLILLDSFTGLRHAVAGVMSDRSADIERIILDRCSSASDYLSLLTELPREFSGDVLMIRDDESGFLSSTGRGGDRVLYALSAQDLRFYLQTHGLVDESDGAMLQLPPLHVLQFRRREAIA
ncbi:MAG TPA: hypothetical protein VF980_15870 [Thermoanaerobaculia bacterium]